MISEDAAAYRVMAVGKIAQLEAELERQANTLEKSHADNGAAVSQNVDESEDAQLLAHLLEEDTALQDEQNRNQTIESARIAADALSEQEARLCREHEERTRVAVWEAVENTRVALSAKSTEEWNNMHESFEAEMKELRSKMGVKLKDEAEKSFAKGRLQHCGGALRTFLQKSLLMKHARAAEPERKRQVLPGRKSRPSGLELRWPTELLLLSATFLSTTFETHGKAKNLCAHACEQAKKS